MNTRNTDLMTLSCEALMNNPAVSNWLKQVLASTLERDPVDALADTEILLAVLRQRCDAALFASESVAELVETLQDELRRDGDEY